VRGCELRDAPKKASLDDADCVNAIMNDSPKREAT